MVKQKSKSQTEPNCLLTNLNLFSVADTTPNVDYFSRDEIKSLVKKFKEAVADGNMNEVSITPKVRMSLALM